MVCNRRCSSAWWTRGLWWRMYWRTADWSACRGRAGPSWQDWGRRVTSDIPTVMTSGRHRKIYLNIHPEKIINVIWYNLNFLNSTCSDAVDSVTSLYNRVEEQAHTLVQRSNMALEHLEYLLQLREMEGHFLQVLCDVSLPTKVEIGSLLSVYIKLSNNCDGPWGSSQAITFTDSDCKLNNLFIIVISKRKEICLFVFK